MPVRTRRSWATWMSCEARGQIALERNERNLGFVRSVNRGMALHPDRDVVLLNSDTEVANDWLDRLQRIALSQPDIGTVTPFSNNATICSYPFEGWSGGMPGTLGLAALDALFASVNPGRIVDLPTGVGFCMYIRRACLAEVGSFDAERFGRGYGEENDFCLRAAAAGWRSVLAGDVFVFHEGAVSFSEERAAQTQVATKTLLDLHPEYVRMVREFVARDPLGVLRAAVDGARRGMGAVEARDVLAERREGRACRRSSNCGKGWRMRRRWWSSATRKSSSCDRRSGMPNRSRSGAARSSSAFTRPGWGSSRSTWRGRNPRARASLRSAPAAKQVANGQAQPHTACLELGQRTILGARREALAGLFKQRLGRKRGEHLARVVLPVRGEVQVAARHEPERELPREPGLQKPALVVSFLRPRVREEDVDAGERGGRDHRA